MEQAVGWISLIIGVTSIIFAYAVKREIDSYFEDKASKDDIKIALDKIDKIKRN